MTVRILLSISRSWREWSTVREVLEQAWARHPGAVLVHGGAARGDMQAAGIWTSLGGEVEEWPADWANCAPDCRHPIKVRRDGTTYCSYAGHRRNVAMVESAPDLVVVFIKDQSRGASHCAQAADAAGLPVMEYVQGKPGVRLRGSLAEEVGEPC